MMCVCVDEGCMGSELFRIPTQCSLARSRPKEAQN